MQVPSVRRFVSKLPKRLADGTCAWLNASRKKKQPFDEGLFSDFKASFCFLIPKLLYFLFYVFSEAP